MKVKGAVHELSRHPIVLLLLTTALGALVVPRVNDLMNRKKSLDEQRQKIMQEIVDQGWEIERLLNTIGTTIEIFRKDHHQFAGSAEFNKWQAEARKSVAETYMEFNAQGWWWVRKVERQAALLEGFPEEEVTVIKDLSDQYIQLLSRSTVQIDRIWTRILREPWTPQTYTDTAKLMEQARNELSQLGHQRRKIIGDMASRFVARGAWSGW